MSTEDIFDDTLLQHFEAHDVFPPSYLSLWCVTFTIPLEWVNELLGTKGVFSIVYAWLWSVETWYLYCPELEIVARNLLPMSHLVRFFVDGGNCRDHHWVHIYDLQISMVTMRYNRINIKYMVLYIVYCIVQLAVVITSIADNFMFGVWFTLSCSSEFGAIRSLFIAHRIFTS